MSGPATPEFSRFLRLEELSGEDGLRREVEAGPDERRALARRFDLDSIDSLRAEFVLRADGPLVRVEGRVTAEVVQRCVVSLEPVPARIDEAVSEVFGPAGYRPSPDDAEAEIPEIFDDDGIDLGELAAQTLLLALDPYPRAPGAETPAEVVGEGRSRPFAALGKMIGRRGK